MISITVIGLGEEGSRLIGRTAEENIEGVNVSENVMDYFLQNHSRRSNVIILVGNPEMLADVSGMMAWASKFLYGSNENTLILFFTVVPSGVAVEEYTSEILGCVDTVFALSEELIPVKKRTKEAVIEYAAELLKNLTVTLSDILFGEGMVSLDYMDMISTFKNKGLGCIGYGTADKDNFMDATLKAVKVEGFDTGIFNAQNVLVNLKGDLGLMQVNEALVTVSDAAGYDANVLFGITDAKKEKKAPIIVSGAACYDENIPFGITNAENEDKVDITVIATGLGK